MFIDGSRYLYQATRKRVYFKSITIIIPTSWSTKAEYRSPGRLTFDDADVRIAPPNSLWAPNPYTHQVQGCGKPGSYIHFIEEFLTSSKTKDAYGPLGNKPSRKALKEKSSLNEAISLVTGFLSIYLLPNVLIFYGY